jgi:hypothetical protein
MSTNTESIEKFIAGAKNPVIRVHEVGVPTGVAKTKGYGDPAEITILLVDEGKFKTRNSPHVRLAGGWRFRRDYGTVRGNCARCRKEAQNEAAWWSNRLDLPLI